LYIFASESLRNRGFSDWAIFIQMSDLKESRGKGFDNLFHCNAKHELRKWRIFCTIVSLEISPWLSV